MPRASRSLWLFPLAFSLAACGEWGSEELLAPQDSDAKVRDVAGLTVMTQNLYLGADIDLLLSGAPPEQVLGGALMQLAQTNFGARAMALAQQIVATQPHLVGLQEVSLFELPEGLGVPTTIDYLGILMAYITAFGGDYVIAADQDNLDISLPLELGGQFVGMVRYVDGDAILARGDVDFDEVESHHFDVQQQLEVAGFTFYNLHGWNALRASWGGHTVRFVNTHLEIQLFAPVQVQQAQQLIDAYADETLPVIMVGDFNSAANPSPEADQATDSYRMFLRAGFADLWLRERHSNPGVTCCQAPTLDNTESVLHSRLDLVLARYGAAGFGGHSWMDILGDESSDLIQVAPGYTLWPSDHAGVIGTLWPAPGLLERWAD